MRARPPVSRFVPFLVLTAAQAGVGVLVALAAGVRDGLYAVLLQLLFAAAYLLVRGWGELREWGAVRRALEDPLAGPLPQVAGPGLAAGAWSGLVRAQREGTARLLASRDAAAREDLDALVAAIHAMKAPVGALGLMADRAGRTGEPLVPADIRAEAEELDRLLDLALGQVRLGDFEGDSRIETVDLGALAAGSLRRHRRLFLGRGVAVDFEPVPVPASTDGKWLGFIVDQLVVNAAKYAVSRVRLTFGQEEGAAVLRIDDDGPGIPEEDRGRLFTRSFVGTVGRGSEDPGPRATGYGLHLAGRAAARLGVSLSLGPRPGAPGTRAEVRVPRFQEER